MKRHFNWVGLVIKGTSVGLLILFVSSLSACAFNQTAIPGSNTPSIEFTSNITETLDAMVPSQEPPIIPGNPDEQPLIASGFPSNVSGTDELTTFVNTDKIQSIINKAGYSIVYYPDTTSNTQILSWTDKNGSCWFDLPQNANDSNFHEENLAAFTKGIAEYVPTNGIGDVLNVFTKVDISTFSKIYACVGVIQNDPTASNYLALEVLLYKTDTNEIIGHMPVRYAVDDSLHFITPEGGDPGLQVGEKTLVWMQLHSEQPVQLSMLEATPTPNYLSLESTPTPNYLSLESTPMPQSFATIQPKPGKVVQIGQWGEGTPTGTAWSPDSTKVAISTDAGIRIFSAPDMKEILFIAAGGSVNHVAFTTDGKQVFAFKGQVIDFWDASSGALVKTIDTQNPSINDVAFSADDSLIAIDRGKGVIEIWSTTSDGKIQTLSTEHDFYSSISFGPDGKTIALAFDKGIQIWDIQNATLTKTVGGEYEILYSPNGKTIVYTSGSWLPHGVYVERLSDGVLLQNLGGNNHNVTMIAFSTDGKLLVSYESYKSPTDYSLILWNMVTWTYIRSVGLPTSGAQYLSFSPDSKYILLGFADSINLYDVKTSTLLQTVSLKDTFVNLTFSPDGGSLTAGKGDGKVEFRDPETGDILATMSEPNYKSGVSVIYSPDGQYIASLTAPHRILIWKIADHSLVNSIPAANATGLVFSPDGSKLAYNSVGQIYIISVPDGKLQKVIPENVYTYKLTGTPSFSPDGQSISSGTIKNLVVTWNIADGKVTSELPIEQTASIFGVMYSPDGKILAAITQDGAEFWDAASGQKSASIRAFQGYALNTSSNPTSPIEGEKYNGECVFSPDSKLLYFMTDMGSIEGVSTSSDFKPLFEYTGNFSGVRSLVVNPMGNNLAAITDSGIILIWGVAQ